MLADIGTKPLQSTRLSYLKKGLQMKTFEEQKNEECDTTEEGGETVRSRQEEIEKVLKMLVLVASIQGVGAQGEEEQRGEGMLVVAVVLVFAVVGFIGVLVECWKRMRGLMRSEEPEEEPQDLPETPVEPEQTSPAFQANPLEEPRVERRSPVPRSPGSVSERRQRSEREERSQEEVQALRTPVRTSERMQTPRSSERVPTPGSSERFPMLRTPRSEEVQTPRTISSDVQLTSVRFTPRGCQTGASRSANGSQRSSGFLDDLMESFNHRDDGYEAGRGSSEVTVERTERAGQGGSPGLRRREVRHQPEPEEEHGRDVRPPPLPPSGGGEHRIYITRWGTKFHTSTTCPSLANSRLQVSPLCPRCVPQGFQRWPTMVFASGPGTPVHFDDTCVAYVGGRIYRRCTLCW